MLLSTTKNAQCVIQKQPFKYCRQKQNNKNIEQKVTQSSLIDDISTSIQKRQVLQLPVILSLAQILNPQGSQAVQGNTPGRVQGLNSEPDSEGYYTYQRPEGKSGGHGVGWTEVPRYKFKIPKGWEETPVSIADLGGTEIDLRFTNKDQGDLIMVVAPVQRFLDVPSNANLRLNDIGDPMKLINGFAPEILQRPLEEDDVQKMEVTQDSEGVQFYKYEVKPHYLFNISATGNRVFVMALNANSRQWRKYNSQLKIILDSLQLPANPYIT